MSHPRYFLPDHPALTEVYSKADLRAMLQSGELSRSEIVVDDETGLGHLLGDLLAAPYPDVTGTPMLTTTGSRPRPPLKQEFRADTPLTRSLPPENVRLHKDADDRDDDDEGDDGFDDEPPAEDCEEDEDDLDERDLFSYSRPVSRQTPPQPLSHRPAGLDDEPEDLFLEPRLSPPAPVLPTSPSLQAEEFSPPAGPTLPSRGGEEILFLGHPSWFAYPKSLAVSFACLGGAAFCITQQYGLEWIVLLGSIAALILVFVSLDRTTTTYFVTTRRVEMEFGLVGRNSKEVRIADIRAIDVRQKSYAALLGIGNVDFDSSASPGAEVRFKDVRRPHDIKQLVRQLQG
ncbi:PH domain-containing protein [Verrucomicrobium spinosum]|uniref:PH domain-containing protein n=1 Tax=Verrucomicrobium spinosum TaxID=2736 RepID=UPI00017448DB|nr:PH domain-containing protein [Verrucomicrobium spinosum]